MKLNKFTLLIIDCQNDLTQKNGSMYIPSCDKVIPNICKFIEDNKENISRIVLAKSSHPKNYCLFKNHIGLYQKNCVENTEGCNIDSRIMKSIKKTGIEFVELKHGEVSDFIEYSASTYSRMVDGNFLLATATDACKIYTNDIVVCGVSGDFMVSETVNDLSNQMNHENIHLFINGIASEDNDIINSLIEEKFDIQII